MLNRNKIIEDVKIRLGYPVVDLAITDDMISRQVDFAIDKVIPYLNNIEVITVNGKVVEFQHKRVYAVIRVTSSSDLESASIDKAINYGFYITNSTRSITNMALWNYYTDSVQQDLNPIGFRLIGDTLYIDGGNAPYTVEAITDESISTMTEDYVNWVVDYTVALTKCIEGEIRSKVKVTGSPVETNGSELKQEGITEKAALEEKLGTSTTLGLFYATR
jgi:hypothetical protein